MTTALRALPLLPFAFALAAGCSEPVADDASDDEAVAESELGATPKNITISVDDCEDPYVIRPVALGGRVSIVAPKDWHVEEALSLDPEELPSTRTSVTGGWKHSWKLNKAQPERFLRRGRFFMIKNDGSTSAQCNFDVVDPTWKRVDASDWIPGVNGDFTQSKDLGVIPAGEGGLVLEGALFGDETFGATFKTLPGSPDPTRATKIGREGNWVYEAKKPGRYKVDVTSFAAGYGRMLTHVTFEIRR
jgi:hypothetical protein